MNSHRQLCDLSEFDRHDTSPRFGAFIKGLFALVIFAFMGAIWGLAMDADFREAQKDEALERAELERVALPAKVLEAYEQGLADAVETMRDSPNGIALAQACLAKGMR